MLEFLQQALAFVLALASIVSAPLAVLGVKNTQYMAAVGGVYQQEVSHPVMGGLYNAMSPTVVSANGQRQMWLSGKPTKDSGDGAIYTSFYNQESGWFEPRPVFSVAGSYVSDPSVIVDPTGSSRYRMYYSSISKTDAASSTLLRLKNHIGQAHSDDGVEWIDDGIVIGQGNGLDDRGGWSPSATVMGEEIWLYYSTNYPDKIHVYRTRLNAAGKPVETQRVFVSGQGGQQPLEGFNVDVHLSRDIGKYVMFLTTDFTGIVRYVSDDGITWTTAKDDKNPVIQAASSSLVAAPTVEVVRYEEGREQYNLFFVGGPISKGLFEGIYQIGGTVNFGTQTQFLDPKAKDYETWSSAGTNSGSGSGSGSGGGMGGLLALGALGIAAIIGLSFLTGAVTAVKELALKSFGGRIVGIKLGLGCINFTIIPAGVFPIDYVWLPSTIQMSISPPKNIVQEVLGVATPTPIPCVGFGAHPPIWYGLPVIMGGTSPI